VGIKERKWGFQLQVGEHIVTQPRNIADAFANDFKSIFGIPSATIICSYFVT
jgi:hypothetical protein